MSFAEFRGSEEFKEIREAEENAQLNQNSEFNDLPDTIKVKQSLVTFPVSENSKTKKSGNNLKDYFYFEMDKNTKDIQSTQNTFNHRVKMCSLAAKGKWSKELENK